MKAVIMAGGKGTRISSVRADIPKPMIEVEGKNILEELLKGESDLEEAAEKILGGEYIIKDALLVIETALQCGLTPQEIQHGLDTYKPIEKRFEEVNIQELKIINDSYNANPDSMKVAIKAFVELYEGDKILVLADMKELGKNEILYHKELGEYLNQFKNLTIYTVGELAKYISETTIHKSVHFCSNIEISKKLKQNTNRTNVLLKGSRSMKLEEIIEEMKK